MRRISSIALAMSLAFVLNSGDDDDPGAFDEPDNVVTDAYGDIYVADTDHHRIQTLDADGNLLRMWGAQGEDPGQLWYTDPSHLMRPQDVEIDQGGQGIAIDDTQDIYIITNIHWVQKWRPVAK